MRIVAGKARGAALKTPPDSRIRPTTDRVRESLFNILTHVPAHGADGFRLEGSRVLDLFAGTGALGLEALSRGAAFCVFIDESAEARGLIRTNVERCNMTGQARISRRDATRLGPVGKYEPFDLVLADPPYGKDLAAAAARSVMQGGWLKPGGLMVLEDAKSAPFDWPDGIETVTERDYGDTMIRIGRAREG